MILQEISAPLTRLYGVGGASEKQLAKLGITTIGHLLAFWPRSFEDRRRMLTLTEAPQAQKASVALSVVAHDYFGFGKMRTLKLIVKDEHGTTAELVCFNRDFLKDKFPVGAQAIVYGSFFFKYGHLQATSFEINRPEDAIQKLLPVYPLTQGLSQKKIRMFIAEALKSYSHTIDSELPVSVRTDFNLPEKKDIVFFMHQPETLEQAERAKYALVFEELFLYQYALGLRSLQNRGSLPRPIDAPQSKIPVNDTTFTPLQRDLQKRLPFELTADQIRSIGEINRDCASLNPMARLIQGDVGSGKTLTAFFAAVQCIEAGGQVALLAPTELLAHQHADNAAKFLQALGIRLAFLSGKVKSKGRKNILSALGKGEIDLIIGTHALFSADVKYNNLHLIIIDEQQRFGVLQRATLLQKGGIHKKAHPHMLMMSATPIPRTMALSVFGDLDISIIKTMPHGRKPIITYVTGMHKAEETYFFVGKQILLGRQAYFLYPLIEESDKISLKSAEEMFAQLQKDFPRHRLALLHSRVSEEEQQHIMHDFQTGAIHILVATSVVEVGVDVPNASCMVIEHAERFGLSALHQLRGRVGRGTEQSYCFLLYGKNLSENGRNRLKIMKETTDGFVIAEADLKMRGPGDIGGLEQSGYLGFSIANPIRDFDIMQQARTAAFKLLANDQASALKGQK